MGVTPHARLGKEAYVTVSPSPRELGMTISNHAPQASLEAKSNKRPSVRIASVYLLMAGEVQVFKVTDLINAASLDRYNVMRFDSFTIRPLAKVI